MPAGAASERGGEPRGEHILTLGSEGRDRPLEIAVMQNVTAMGRLFEFKNRAVFNFPDYFPMVNEMPVHEPELCGRIRDHLAIATGSRRCLEAFLATAENRRKQEGLQAGLHHIAKITELLDQQEQQARIDAATIIFHLQEVWRTPLSASA